MEINVILFSNLYVAVILYIFEHSKFSEILPFQSKMPLKKN